jgi:acetyl-CoA C-acetyltransferase
VTIDPRTPVLIGSGQFLHHAEGLDDALEPVSLMAAAVDRAVEDAGLRGVPAVDSIRVVSLLSWRYGNPALVLAERLGVEGVAIGDGQGVGFAVADEGAPFGPVPGGLFG